MKIPTLYNSKVIAAQLLLLCIPAMLIGAYMLWDINKYFTVLNNQWILQTVYYSLGLFSGCLFFNRRFRFLTTFLPLILLLYIIAGITYD